MNNRREHIFMWFIENYSNVVENEESLLSPNFAALEGKAWYVSLYPRGPKKENIGFISICLRREEDDGPEIIFLDYELYILAVDESKHRVIKLQHSFKKGTGFGAENLISTENELLREKNDYLPRDTLTVCCKMWMGKGNIDKVGLTVARTRIAIEKISFLHIVENFSELECNQTKTVNIQFPSKEDSDVSSCFYLADSREGKIIVEIMASGSECLLVQQKIFVLDTHGNITACGEIDNRFLTTTKEKSKMTLSLTRQSILERKSEYLPMDELSLFCECTFYTGVEFEKIEEIIHELPVVAFRQTYDNVCNKNVFNDAACPSALDDLATIFNSQYLTDVQLKTKAKSFPAHKLVLSARSPVFKAMFDNYMKEKNTSCIQVDDLEDETVQQFLQFLYSDKIENLQWESAVKLYYASDKYVVEKLKLKCSSYLVDNLSTSTASELLLLADKHNDSDLKNFVEDFILDHEDDVFGSDEWENLIETNPQLVIKTMHLKYKRRKGGK